MELDIVTMNVEELRLILSSVDLAGLVRTAIAIGVVVVVVGLYAITILHSILGLLLDIRNSRED